MVTNFPGPYEVRLRYTTDGITHVTKLNCFVDGTPTPGTPSTSIDVVQRDASLLNIETALTEYLAPLRDFFPTTATYDYAELWSYPPASTDGTFITGWVVGLAGLNANPVSAASQQTLTYRTLEGNIYKQVLLEYSVGGNGQVTYASDSADWQEVVDYMLSDDSWVIGRDTSFPIAYIRRSAGQNEALFRRRFRP